MRVDKYLKVARIIKRRAIAKELADNDRIMINSKLAKASSEVKNEDILEIMFGHRTLKIKVLEIKEYVKKDDSSSMFEILE